MFCIAMSTNPLRRKYSRHIDIRKYFWPGTVFCWRHAAYPPPDAPYGRQYAYYESPWTRPQTTPFTGESDESNKQIN